MEITPVNVDDGRAPMPKDKRSTVPWVWRGVIAGLASIYLAACLLAATAPTVNRAVMTLRYSQGASLESQSVVTSAFGLIVLTLTLTTFVLTILGKTFGQMAKRVGLMALASTALAGFILPPVTAAFVPRMYDSYNTGAGTPDEALVSLLTLGVISLGVSFVMRQLSKRGVKLPSAKASVGALQQLGVLPNPVASPSTKKCPFCAETIQQEAKFCRFCQHDLTPAAPPFAETAESRH